MEVLFHLAEIGHGSVVQPLPGYNIKHCIEILLILVTQVKGKLHSLDSFFPIKSFFLNLYLTFYCFVVTKTGVTLLSRLHQMNFNMKY